MPPIDDAGHDGTLTRSEERLVVGTIRRPYARLRMRKVVVTREVTMTVKVRREEFRLERLPPVDADGTVAAIDPEVGAEELLHEFVLHEEVPVVHMDVRPVEVIRVERQVHQRRVPVSGEVRREQVDVVPLTADQVAPAIMGPG